MSQCCHARYMIKRRSVGAGVEGSAVFETMLGINKATQKDIAINQTILGPERKFLREELEALDPVLLKVQI